MIIGLAGYAQSGKDTVAKALVNHHGFVRMAFADSLRDFVYKANPMVDNLAGEPKFVQEYVDTVGWDKAKQHPQVRRILQTTGLAAREQFGVDFWVSQVLKHVQPTDKVVITDVRFLNEADSIKACGVDTQIWRVKRDGVEAVNGHVSETQLDSYLFDRTIYNNGTVDELWQTVRYFSTLDSPM